MGSPTCSLWLRRLIEAVSLVALLAAGTGTIVGFGGRIGWLCELTCHFRVQYFWALMLACAGLSLARRKLVACAAAALAVVNLALIAPLYIGPAPPFNDSDSLRAMSFNVHWLNRDFDRTLDLIRHENPDFVALFEVTPEWADALHALDGGYPYSRVIPRQDSGGMALFSRLPMEHVTVHHLADIRLPTIEATLITPQGPLHLLATHPASPISPLNFEYRNRQLTEVAKLAHAQGGAVMVLGDLNITSWSPFFHDLLAASGLADSRRGFGVEGSWPGVPLPLRIPIDHCLVSRQIEVRDRRVARAAGSDHRPIIVDFTLRFRPHAKPNAAGK